MLHLDKKLILKGFCKWSSGSFLIWYPISKMGAKGDWDFRSSGLVKNPDGTDILTSMVNFSEIWKTH